MQLVSTEYVSVLRQLRVTGSIYLYADWDINVSGSSVGRIAVLLVNKVLGISST
jgi:hypothetical protein